MANDTNDERIKRVLGRCYDGCTDLSIYRQTANAVGDRVVSKAVEEGYSHSASEVVLMKSWLGAYYYTRMDPTYKSKSTLGASGTFNSSPDDFLKGAKDVDGSGWLDAIVNGMVASVEWGGKTATDALDWWERN